MIAGRAFCPACSVCCSMGVTCVLAADAAMGCGIFIGNMLDTAENYESIS